MNELQKHYECLGCGAIISVVVDITNPKRRITPAQMVGSDGKPLGCSFCGDKRYRVVYDNLPDTKEELPAV